MRYDTRRITLSQDKAVAAQAEARRLALGGACAPISRSPAPTVRRTWRVRVGPQCSTNTRTRSVSALVADRLNGSRTTAVVGHDDATHQIERASEGYHNLTARRRVAAQSLCRGAHIELTSCHAPDRLIGVDREPAPWLGSASARAIAVAPVNVPISSTRRAPIVHISPSRSRTSLTPPAIPGKGVTFWVWLSSAETAPTGPSSTCPHTAQHRTRSAIASARHRRRDRPGRQSRTPPEVVCSGQ